MTEEQKAAIKAELDKLTKEDLAEMALNLKMAKEDSDKANAEERKAIIQSFFSDPAGRKGGKPAAGEGADEEGADNPPALKDNKSFEDLKNRLKGR